MYKHMQDLMEESGSYVFLTHGAVGVALSRHYRPGDLAERHADLYKFKKA